MRRASARRCRGRKKKNSEFGSRNSHPPTLGETADHADERRYLEDSASKRATQGAIIRIVWSQVLKRDDPPVRQCERWLLILSGANEHFISKREMPPSLPQHHLRLTTPRHHRFAHRRGSVGGVNLDEVEAFRHIQAQPGRSHRQPLAEPRVAPVDGRGDQIASRLGDARLPRSPPSDGGGMTLSCPRGFICTGTSPAGNET